MIVSFWKSSDQRSILLRFLVEIMISPELKVDSAVATKPGPWFDPSHWRFVLKIYLQLLVFFDETKEGEAGNVHLQEKLRSPSISIVFP